VAPAATAQTSILTLALTTAHPTKSWEILNSKHQIPNNIKIQMSQTPNTKQFERDAFLVFGFWRFEFV
jgi:hypothetical protein